MPHRQALILGASGIAGWAFTRECLIYPGVETFDRVIALSCRSSDKKFFTFDADGGFDDLKVQTQLDKLETFEGIDLRDERVSEKIASIPNIEKTTHVFNTAYAGHDEAYGSSNPFGRLEEINLVVLKQALAAVAKSCPKVEFWLQISGTKSYGFELGGFPDFAAVAPALPWKEADLPLPAPFGDMVFYNAQHKLLEQESKGKPWRFVELIPNMIIGYSPRSNPMSWIQSLALFLSFYKEHSGSTEISWAGSEATYTCLVGDTSQDIMARAGIHLALNLKESGHRVNTSDNEQPVPVETLWQESCAYFGLKGTGPRTDAKQVYDTKWLLEKKSEWPAFEQKHGLKQGIMENTLWTPLQMMFDIGFPRYLDLSVVQNMGFSETRDHFVGYKIAFERLRAAKYLP